jgi:hypothetical protein
MKYQSFKDRHFPGGYDPELLNPDSTIEDLGNALLEEVMSVGCGLYDIGDLLEVIRLHLSRHALDQDGLAYLAALWSLAAALKEAEKRIRRLLAKVTSLDNDPSVIAARARYSREPFSAEAGRFATGVRKILELQDKVGRIKDA